MPLKPLPARPCLDHFRRQARDLQSDFRRREPAAAQRIREFHPRRSDQGDEAVFSAPFSLADAQLTIAREYGLSSWNRLRTFVAGEGARSATRPREEQIVDPDFREAIAYMDAGNEAALLALLVAHPELVLRRIDFPVHDYFGRPTLLEFIAENPVRTGEMPSNIANIARIVLDAGAREDREAVTRTLGLVASGSVARKTGHQIELIDLLCDCGANPDAALDPAIGQGEFSAAEALLCRGARLTLAGAAAMGRASDFRGLFPGAGAEERHRALAWAAQYGHVDIVDALLRAGEDPRRYNPPGAHAHSTPLHQAALAGHLSVVRLLVEAGADLDARDILYQGTPLGWALHGGQSQVAEYLKSRQSA